MYLFIFHKIVLKNHVCFLIFFFFFNLWIFSQILKLKNYFNYLFSNRLSFVLMLNIGWKQRRRVQRRKIKNNDLHSWQGVKLIIWKMDIDGESMVKKLWKTALFLGNMSTLFSISILYLVCVFISNGKLYYFYYNSISLKIQIFQNIFKLEQSM